MNNLNKSLKDRAKEFSVQLPFMEGKEKGEFKTLMGQPVTINQFGFLRDTNTKTGEIKEYACFTVAEDSKRFFFGGMVLTDNLRELENDGFKDEIEDEGLPVMFGEKKSKNKTTYTTVEFYPEIKPADPDPKAEKGK